MGTQKTVPTSKLWQKQIALEQLHENNFISVDKKKCHSFEVICPKCINNSFFCFYTLFLHDEDEDVSSNVIKREGAIREEDEKKN